MNDRNDDTSNSFKADPDVARTHTFLTNRFGDRYLYEVNGNSFNAVGSDGVYNQRWSHKLFRETCLYIVAGSDCGILINYIIKHGVPESSRYLIVELEEFIDLVRPFVEEYEKKKKIVLCTVNEWLTTASSCSFSEYAYLDSVKLVKSIAVEDKFYSAYSSMWRKLESEFQMRMWQYRVEFGNCTFLARQIENLAENQFSAGMLRNLFKGKTAVLLAGGPSLDETIPWVVKNREQLVVISVSRIARRLQQVDLEPDIFVTVDPHPVSFDVSKHILFSSNAILVNAFHATPLLLGQWPGINLYLDQRLPWESKKSKKLVNGTGPTVSNSALNLAIAMGFSQVVLAGLDLCFSQEGFSHALGSDERKVGAFVAYGNHTVETNNGRIADTDNSFYNGIQSIEAQAEAAMEHNCQFINPSQNAAKMKNVVHKSLDLITITPLSVPAKVIIQRALPNNDSQTRTQYYIDTIKELDRAEHQLVQLSSLSRKGLEYNDGLFGRNGKKKDFKNKIKMDKVEKTISRKYREMSNLAKIFGMAQFVRTLHPDDSQEWSDAEVEETGRNYYDSYIYGADKLKEIIKEQKERLKSRIEEEQDNPDFEKLFYRWHKDSQFGRATIWRKRHPEKYQVLDETIKDQFIELEAALHTEIAKTDHSYMMEINKFADLKGVTGKAFELYQHKDNVGLERLKAGLKTRTESEAKVLTDIVEAFILELKNENGKAIELYKKIVDESEDKKTRVVENALTRLAVLLLDRKDLDQCSYYLQKLAAMTPARMPFYADILRINNKAEEAINVYSDYLLLAPEDRATMMKLGLFYLKLEIYEAAEWIFNHIVEKDPHNTAAKTLLKEVRVKSESKAI